MISPGFSKAAKPADVKSALDTLLEQQVWPETLQADATYCRRQDDTDGETGFEHDLMVYLGRDTDTHIIVMGHALRFREIFGGGMSPRTRNALLVLAEAIRRDNENHPQTKE